MSWLLELLVDAIREMCSQFIVDMMELITNMFTELLSCNLSLFEELFSVVGSLYKNVIVPTGIAILLMILVWQLFKSMFGGKAGVNAEEPIELICRSAISLFLLAGSKPLVDYILRIAGTPYQWVVGTKVKVASFSGYVSTLEGVTDTLGISSLSISVLMLIMQFVVAWNYFKMLMVIAERYVLLGVFSYTAPLAFATGGSKATNNILASWSKMFGGQVVLVILNAWCMKMFLSGYGNMMASSYGFTKFFAATLCLVGFCKITFKLDSYMASLGVNLGRPAPGMGAAGAMLAASRIISQAARTASGSGATGDVGGTRTDMGSADGMTTNFTGPIPMTPNGGNAMDINDMTSDGDFDKESPPGPGNQQNEVSQANKTVFEELGMTTGSSDTAEMDFGSGDHVNGNIDSMSATSETTYYSDRTGEITVSVASIRKNFFTIRATDYVPEYSESRSIGKRQLLLPDEILRYPLDQGILIIRGHNVLRFKKMDYTEHADAGKLKMEKVVDHIPDWYRKWEKQQQEFQILDEQVYEALDPLEKNESPIKENDVQEPLTVNGAVQKPKNKKRTGNGNTVMKVDDLFVKKSKG